METDQPTLKELTCLATQLVNLNPDGSIADLDATRDKIQQSTGVSRWRATNAMVRAARLKRAEQSRPTRSEIEDTLQMLQAGIKCFPVGLLDPDGARIFHVKFRPKPSRPSLPHNGIPCGATGKRVKGRAGKPDGTCKRCQAILNEATALYERELTEKREQEAQRRADEERARLHRLRVHWVAPKGPKMPDPIH